MIIMNDIITDQQLDYLIPLLVDAYYSMSGDYVDIDIIFDDQTYSLFTIYNGATRLTDAKKILAARSVIQIRDALIETKIYNGAHIDFLNNIIISDLNSRIGKSEIVMASLTQRVDAISDKLDILIDILQLKQIV